MTEDLYVHVVDWDRFQHGTTRDNPWIKDYTAQLHKDEFLELSFHLRGVLQSIRLSYAASHRQLRHSTATLNRQLGQRVTTRDIEALVQAGFLTVGASTVLAQSRGEKSREEKPPDPLLETGPLAAVFSVLSAIDKPGYQPPKFRPDRLAVVLARFPDLDAAAEAENLADWERDGKGAARQTTDGIRAFRNWLQRARPPLAAVADPDEVPPGYNRGTYRRLTPADQAWYPGQEETA